ncbi:MAG: hypothetical protein K8R21_03335 [Leptospira sp.]|nr:hypothetical protein [Leptospira sp.]
MSDILTEKAPSTPNEYVEYLKKAADAGKLRRPMVELLKKAKSGDKLVWSVIYQLMRDADSGRISWALHNDLLSGIIFLLSEVGDNQSYRILISYIKALHREIPIGALELISGLVPAFSNVDIGELFEMASGTNELKSAFGIMAISSLVIENKLSAKEQEKLLKILDGYKNFKYYLNDQVDLIRTHIEEMKSGDSAFSSSELDSLFV